MNKALILLLALCRTTRHPGQQQSCSTRPGAFWTFVVGAGLVVLLVAFRGDAALRLPMLVTVPLVGT
jgi:hypothetical protein